MEGLKGMEGIKEVMGVYGIEGRRYKGNEGKGKDGDYGVDGRDGGDEEDAGGMTLPREFTGRKAMIENNHTEVRALIRDGKVPESVVEN